jgi:hypothetical protein
VRIEERTLTDALSIYLESKNSEVFETYEMNGKKTVFRRSLETGTMLASDVDSRLVQRTERPVEWTPCGEPECLKLAYPAGSTLEDNREGNRLMKLLANARFVEWLAISLGQEASFRNGMSLTADRGEFDKRRRAMCGWASICNLVKCTFGGGLLNPLCHACMGISFSCMLMFILCDTFGLCS